MQQPSPLGVGVGSGSPGEGLGTRLPRAMLSQSWRAVRTPVELATLTCRQQGAERPQEHGQRAQEACGWHCPGQCCELSVHADRVSWSLPPAQDRGWAGTLGHSSRGSHGVWPLGVSVAPTWAPCVLGAWCWWGEGRKVGAVQVRGTLSPLPTQAAHRDTRAVLNTRWAPITCVHPTSCRPRG